MDSSPMSTRSGVASEFCGAPVDGQPQPGVEFGRPGRVEHDVVDGPLGRQRDQAALGEHGDHRLTRCPTALSTRVNAARSARSRRASMSNRSPTRVVDERRRVERQHGDRMGQQAEGGSTSVVGCDCSGEQYQFHARLLEQ